MSKAKQVLEILESVKTVNEASSTFEVHLEFPTADQYTEVIDDLTGLGAKMSRLDGKNIKTYPTYYKGTHVFIALAPDSKVQKKVREYLDDSSVTYFE